MSHAIKKTNPILKSTIPIAQEVSPEQIKPCHEKTKKNTTNLKSLSNNNIDPKELEDNQQHLANQNVKIRKRAGIESGNSTEVIQKQFEQTQRETELQETLDLKAVQSTTIEQQNLAEQANRQLSTKQNVVIKKLDSKKEDVKKSLSEVNSAVIPVKKEASGDRGKLSYGNTESQGINANYLKPLASKNSEQKLQNQTADRRASEKKNDKENVEQSRKEENSNQTAEMTKNNATDLNSCLISTAQAKANQQNNEHKLHRVSFDRQALTKQNDRNNEPVAQRSLPNTNYPVIPAAQKGKYEKPEPFMEIIEQLEADDKSLQFLAHKYNDQQHLEAQVAHQLLLKQQVTRKEEKVRDYRTSYETKRNLPNFPFDYGVEQGTHQEYQHVDKTVKPLASKNNEQQLFQQQVDAKASKPPCKSQMQEPTKEDEGMQTFLGAKQNDMPDINNIALSHVPVDRQTLLKPGANPLENESNHQTLDGKKRVNDQPLSLETGIKRSKSNTKIKQTLKQGSNRKNDDPYSPHMKVKPDAKVERKHQPSVKQQSKTKNLENKMEERRENNTEKVSNEKQALDIKKLSTDMNHIPDEANKSAEKGETEMELGQKQLQQPSANDALNLEEIERKKEMSPENRELKRKLDDQKPNVQKTETLENPPLKKIKYDAEKHKIQKPPVKQPKIKKQKEKTKYKEEGSEKVSGEKKAPAAKKKTTETDEIEAEKNQSQQPNVNQALSLEAIAKKIESNTENEDISIKLGDQKPMLQESETLRKEEQQQLNIKEHKKHNLDNYRKGACENNTEDISSTKKEPVTRKISTETQQKGVNLEVARKDDMIPDNKELKRKLDDQQPQFQKTETLENPPQKKRKSDAKEKQKEQKPLVKQPEIKKLKQIESIKEQRSENNTEKVSADEKVPEVKKKGVQTNLISDEASEDAEKGRTEKKMALKQQRVQKVPNLEEIVRKMETDINNSESFRKLGDHKPNSQKTEALKVPTLKKRESNAKEERNNADKEEIGKMLELKEAQQANVNQVQNLKTLAKRMEINQENVDQTTKVEQKTEVIVKKPLLDAQLKSESDIKPTETHKIATNIPSTPKLVAPNLTNHPENEAPPNIPFIKKLENNMGIGFFEMTAAAQKRSSAGLFKMETNPKSDVAQKDAFDMPTIPRRILPVAQKPILGIKDLQPKRGPGFVTVSKPSSTAKEEIASMMPRSSISQSSESNVTEANKSLLISKEEIASNVTNAQKNVPINQKASFIQSKAMCKRLKHV
ncbi:neurofilament heavy polypeptide-like [Drosophila novamexicana]|uniref:neurofilament heavy polypeptide-like n=1 Tax=Drosophila novamexicana TaxID=47314 RepID=UPI0011E5F2B4|nr:neurofilament heavy polypeptide-like [Drosophila novamexicana]